MITDRLLINKNDAGIQGDSSIGNDMFRIAGIIGIATKNGYEYGFKNWRQQKFFVNPLPEAKNIIYKRKTVTPNYKGIDFGFQGFDYEDNIDLNGEFGSWKYFEHCEDLIRHYFTIKPQCDPYKDCILMHYRDYTGWTGWANLGHDYYSRALKQLPKKRVIVVTDNIDKAYKSIQIGCEYTSNTPIVDLYLLSQADYLVMANSSFSWWGAWLSRAVTVAPLNWYDGELKDAPINDAYLPNWILV